MYEIVDYIVDGSHPPNKYEARKLQLKSTKYCMFGGQLNERSFAGPLFKCLGPKATLKVMAEMHDCFCGNHSRRRSMARRIMLQGFYWSTLMKDSERYSR